MKLRITLVASIILFTAVCRGEERFAAGHAFPKPEGVGSFPIIESLTPDGIPPNTSPKRTPVQRDRRPVLSFYTQPNCIPCKIPEAVFAALTPEERAALPFQIRIESPPSSIPSTPYFAWYDVNHKRWGIDEWTSLDDLTVRYRKTQGLAVERIETAKAMAAAAKAACLKASAAAQAMAKRLYASAGVYVRHWNWPRWHGSLQNHMRMIHHLDTSSWTQEQRERWHDAHHDRFGP